MYSSYQDKIKGGGLEDMQLINKYNKGVKFWLCVIDIYSDFAWVFLIMDRKDITITNAFQKVLQESGRKSNKIWTE